MRKRYTIVVHGGVGDEVEPKTSEEQAPYLSGLREALDAGKGVLEAGGSALGAGTSASNDAVAVSCTGTGEQFIRYAVAHEVYSLMKYAHCTVQEAADKLIHSVLEKGDGGLIAVDRQGNFAVPFNTPQMWRGVADSDGLYEVKLD